ncbi:diguanylate cyclase [Chitinibacteraceae bacterium HSL-7]
MSADSATAPRPLMIFALMACVIFVAAWAGILTRPLQHLATVWPANALMLGLLVRFPALARPAGWLGGVAGFLLAAWTSSDSGLVTVLLTLANLAGIVVGYMLFAQRSNDERRLRTPQSVILLALICCVAGAAAGVVGAVADPLLFGGTPGQGWLFWFVTETVNYMGVLPVVLTLPALRNWSARDYFRVLRPLGPLVALAVSFVAGLAVGGHGAVVLPLPALIWCAISYPVFHTALLTLIYSYWGLGAVSQGWLAVSQIEMASRPMLMSVRIGLALVALGPLTVASVLAVRNALQRQLEHLAMHDQLTGLLNRRAFSMQAAALMKSDATQLSVLMLDIDHFKQINDNYGHAAGDAVLQRFAALVRQTMPSQALAGRLGGEEFALVLPGIDAQAALEVAERVRQTFAESQLTLDDGRVVGTTVSIGVATELTIRARLEPMVARADHALYRAKHAGRNRCEAA